MFDLFNKQGFLGVDFSHTIKLAQLEDDTYKTKRIKRLSKEGLRGFNNKKVAAAINSEQVDIRFVDVADNLAQEDVEKLVKLEFDGDNLVVQHEIIDFFEQRYAIAFAVERNLIQDKFDKLKKVGLKPRIMETEFHANLRFLLNKRENTDKTISLIDIGKKRTDLLIVKEQELVFARNFKFGGDNITKSLSKRNKISIAEADQQKKAGIEQEELKIVLEGLRSQVYSSIDYFQSEYKEQVSQMILTGGSSKLKGLKKYLKNQIGLEVKRLDEGSYSVAKGLALRKEE